MSKRIMLIVFLVLVAMASPAKAGGPVPTDNGIGINSGQIVNDSVVKSTSARIYNVCLVASASNAQMNIFDQSALPKTGTPVYEVAQATSGNSTCVDFKTPLSMQSGIVVSFTNGSGYMNYR